VNVSQRWGQYYSTWDINDEGEKERKERRNNEKEMRNLSMLPARGSMVPVLLQLGDRE